MVSKKVIIGIVAVLVVVVIAAAVIGGGDDSPEARYNYKVELADSFQWTGESGTVYNEKPDAGMQYAILTYTVYNDSYSDAISTNSIIWVWKIVADNIEYSDNIDTFSHPGYKLVEVQKGGHATQVLVYQIPASLTESDIKVTQDYTWTFDPPKLKLDETITV